MSHLARPETFGFIVENIGGGEIVVIAFLALVVLGPDRIPEMARGAGRLINRAKSMTNDLTGDMADVINDPAMQPIRELGEFATRPRQKLAEYALEAEAEERQRKADSDEGTGSDKGTGPDEIADTDRSADPDTTAGAGGEVDGTAPADPAAEPSGAEVPGPTEGPRQAENPEENPQPPRDGTDLQDGTDLHDGVASEPAAES